MVASTLNLSGSFAVYLTLVIFPGCGYETPPCTAIASNTSTWKDNRQHLLGGGSTQKTTRSASFWRGTKKPRHRTTA